MDIKKEYIRKYWFGIDKEDELAEIVLLMERDRIEQYKAALDITTNHFSAVFKGITGFLDGVRISVIYSIGPAHIADCVNFLTYAFEIKKIFSTGSVGGMNAEMGDVIITNACATQDGFGLHQKQSEVKEDSKLGRYTEIFMGKTLSVSPKVKNLLSETFNCDIKTGQMFTIPCVSMEDMETLQEIKNQGFIALDLETGPFLAACEANQVEGICIHWVTDLPIERDFYYKYHGDQEIAKRDQDKKHRQWLNMPKLILPVVKDLMQQDH